MTVVRLAGRAPIPGIPGIPAIPVVSRIALVLALTVGVAAACDSADATGQDTAEASLLAKREARTNAAIAGADSGAPPSAPIARWILPNTIKEVSGLALTPDQRLLAHDDTHGRVIEIDYKRGTVVKQFLLAPALGKVDFEGITVAENAVFMIASNGFLYEFAEGAAGADVAYTVHDTGLTGDCEFEGVAYDPSIKSLLLACKVVKVQALKDSVVIYRWKLDAGLARAERLSRMSIGPAAIGLQGGKVLNPSDITVDPKTGNYVLISARERAIVELTPAGAVVSSGTLPGAHPQAEGIAITKDRVMIVSDEAAAGPATITLYRRP